MKKTEKVTVIAFTDRAKTIGEEAARILGLVGYVPEILDGRKVKISAEMERIFSDSRFIVFVSAVGIAVPGSWRRTREGTSSYPFSQAIWEEPTSLPKCWQTALEPCR